MIKKLLSVVVLFLILGCQKDDTTTLTIATPNATEWGKIVDNFGNDITSDFMGMIVDENNSPILGANVQIGNESTTTNAQGIFILKSVTVKEKFAYVKVSKSGYFQGSRSMRPSSGMNKLTVMLVSKSNSQTVNSGEAVTLNQPDGSSVSLSGNYVDAAGNPYSGSVRVAMDYLAPSDPNLSAKMPGMLLAETSEGNEIGLRTLGMLFVELESDTGEKLQLAPGTAAAIKIPVDTSQTNIPNSIPLWYFHEDLGYWVQEGIATRVGNYYEGTVTHFTVWNVDEAIETVQLCVTVNNIDTVPVDGVTIQMFTPELGYGTLFIASDEGTVCFDVPKDESLTISVLDFCGNEQNMTFGPYATDTTETITLSGAIETISGTLLNCEGVPVSNGLVSTMIQGIPYFTATQNGTFAIDVFGCPEATQFSITGVDVDNLQSGTAGAVLSGNDVNIGSIYTCDAVDQYFIYTLDGVKETFLETNSSTFDPHGENLNAMYSNKHFYVSYDASGSDFFILNIKLKGPDNNLDTDDGSSPQTGIYTGVKEWIEVYRRKPEANESFSIEQFETPIIGAPGGGNLNASDNFTVTVTSLGTGIDEYIDLYFSGNFDDNGTSRFIEGNAHIKIDIVE